MPPLITDADLPYSVQRNYISIQRWLLQDIGRGSFKCSIKIHVTIWLLLIHNIGTTSELLTKSFCLPHTSKILCNSQAGEDSPHFTWHLHFIFVVHCISIPGLFRCQWSDLFRCQTTTHLSRIPHRLQQNHLPFQKPRQSHLLSQIPHAIEYKDNPPTRRAPSSNQNLDAGAGKTHIVPPH